MFLGDVKTVKAHKSKYQGKEKWEKENLRDLQKANLNYSAEY